MQHLSWVLTVEAGLTKPRGIKADRLGEVEPPPPPRWSRTSALAHAAAGLERVGSATTGRHGRGCACLASAEAEEGSRERMWTRSGGGERAEPGAAREGSRLPWTMMKRVADPNRPTSNGLDLMFA